MSRKSDPPPSSKKPTGGFGVSEPFIRRPIATSLLALAILLAGIVAYRLLPVSPLPKVDLPTIQVQAALPGASPETMASSVATPLERRFGRIAGVTEITSTSSLGNVSITLQFDLDRDVEAAARDVQAAINAAGGELPANLPTRPRYQKVNPADAPILILYASSKSMQLSDVFDTANTVLAQKLSQVNGVGQVFVGGGQQPAVRVQVDPAALAARGIGIPDVQAVLVGSTADYPKGALQGDKQAQVIAANDQLFDADKYADLVIGKDATGASIRLGDVARVFEDVENNRVAGWFNTDRAVVIVIRRQPGANILDTIDRVKATLPHLKDSISPSIELGIATDRAGTIRASVKDVEHTLVLTVVLVVGVVFIFLRSPSATAIPSVAVPVSIVGTFAVMYMLDYSLDNLSLMALTISTGFVVDDAIVVTENVTRYLEEGYEPLEAALLGAKQIGFTIVSITASLLAVFIPLLFMGGIVGRLFREFSVTLAISISVSAVVSLTLTPMMCAKLLKSQKNVEHGVAYRVSERGFDIILAGYDHGLRWVLRHHFFTLCLTFATILVTGYLYATIPKGLFPQQDSGLLAGFSEGAQDISFGALRDRQEAVNAIISADPDVESFISFIGGGSAVGNTGSAFINLKPIGVRKISGDEVIGRLRPQLAKLYGVNMFMQVIQDVRIGGRAARTQYQYTLQDADLNELREWAPRLVDKLKKVPELKDVATDQQTAGLELGVVIDRDAAARFGIQPLQIDQTLYGAFGQEQVAVTYTQLNQYRVVLEVKPDLQRNPDSLHSIYVKSPQGGQVPLDTFSTFVPRMTSLSINHQGQFPAVTVSFNLAPGKALSDAVAAIDRAQADIGFPLSIHAGFQGTAQAFGASLASQPKLILAALLTVYIVLGMLYESLVHPVTILSTIPSAGVGALVALLLTHTELNVIALVGIILLIGIVKKNAIMMIDFAIEAERDEGLSPMEAIHKACLLRFRPIMMTTMAALLGGLPLALGQGAGSELRRPLGIAIVGGLFFSQCLTLFTTPVVYLSLDRFTKRRQIPGHEPENETPQPTRLLGNK